jgi:arylsulfatase A-like enzyme
VLQERYAEITAMDRAMGRLRQYLAADGLRQNTLLWYCGDNGIPASGRATTPFRGQKGQVYEGGIRVPGTIEWPARIREPRVTKVNAVTSDILPTICDLVGQPLPDRPLDGISLRPLIDGELTERPNPICFWNYEASRDNGGELKPYIDAKLQEGTTPLVKMMGGRLTRNFINFHHTSITDQDFGGAKVILDNRYKLVVHGKPGSESIRELFDVRDDPAEENNLIDSKPDIAKNLERQLHDWQKSVLNSLTGADY